MGRGAACVYRQCHPRAVNEKPLARLNHDEEDESYARGGRRSLAVIAAALLALFGTSCERHEPPSPLGVLLRDGEPGACAHRATATALRAVLGPEAGALRPITFQGGEKNLLQVRCNVRTPTGEVTYSVSENLATPGEAVVKILRDERSAPSPPATPTIEATSPPAPRLQAARGYTFDISKNYPTAFAIWRSRSRSLPLAERPWLRTLNGTAGPLTEVNNGVDDYIAGTVCEPHNCGGNIMAIMFTKDERRLVAKVTLTSVSGEESVAFVGDPSPAEMRCLSYVLENYDLTDC